MLKNIIPRHPVEIEERSIDFTNEAGGGMRFDCDEDGTPKFQGEAARFNYEYAIAHPDLYHAEYNVVKRWKRTIIEPAHGTCPCGETVYLTDEYIGACQCPRCGRWYNLYGQELIPPEYWED